MENDLMQTSAVVLVLFGGIVSWGCSSDRPASDATSVNAPGNTGPDTTTGPGAGESTDTAPNMNEPNANPDKIDNPSTGSTGPDLGTSSATPNASPVH
ncbi:MAG TPA: hypothetical protein VHV51_14955 [Polyangiaceae bacterium]|jgi:hypothetical protein|nr:hypothetical protein [Polyangiaceae bacterium]